MTTWSSAAREIADAIHAVDSGAGVIILTDLFGGTPSNLAISLMEAGQGRSDRRDQPADADPAGQGAQGAWTCTDAVHAARDAGRNYITIASRIPGAGQRLIGPRHRVSRMSEARETVKIVNQRGLARAGQRQVRQRGRDAARRGAGHASARTAHECGGRLDPRADDAGRGQGRHGRNRSRGAAKGCRCCALARSWLGLVEGRLRRGLRYTSGIGRIMRRHDHRLFQSHGQVSALAARKEAPQGAGKFLAEGLRLLTDARECGQLPEMLVMADGPRTPSAAGTRWKLTSRRRAAR